MTTLDHRTALVTGANRGLGKEFVAQLLERGVDRIYAAARDPRTVVVTDERVIPLGLDVTDAESVARAAETATDVTVLINNAGIARSTSVLDADQGDLRAELETNLFGPLRTTSAFADSLAGPTGGVVLNVHSVLSWIALGSSYSVSKAAIWSATNSLRLELAPRGVQVVGLHVGYIDTDMAAHAQGPKSSPADVVRQSLDGIAAGALEVLADDLSRQVKAGLAAPLEALYPQLLDRVA